MIKKPIQTFTKAKMTVAGDPVVHEVEVGEWDLKPATNQWINMDGFKIYDNGLWKVKDLTNPLSELVEVSELKYLGLEEGVHIYLCEEPPLEVKELMVETPSEDSHVYLGVKNENNSQSAMLWPY